MRAIGLLKRPKKEARFAAIGLILWSAFFFLGALRPRLSEAQITGPTMADGSYLTPPDAPCIPYNAGAATGTTQVAVRTSGPGYVPWVYLGTGTAVGAGVAEYVIFRDTGSTGNTGIDQFRVYWSTSPGGLIQFRPPFRFTNGLTMEKSVAAANAEVCTRLYGTQSP